VRLSEQLKEIKKSDISISRKQLKGQRVALDINRRLLFLWLKAGPYLKAGKRYGWKGVGFGVNKAILNYASSFEYRLCIISDGKLDRYYKAKKNCLEIKWFCEDKKAVERRRGQIIYVLPFTDEFFETVYEAEVVEAVIKALGGETLDEV
jgi:hypothetical protein